MKDTAVLLLGLVLAVGTTVAFPEHLFRHQTADSDADVKHWALLIAGSNGWYNYRHQADICHAYQILHKHGIPDEQIIVMMYDDIANNEDCNQAIQINVMYGGEKKYIHHKVNYLLTARRALTLIQSDIPNALLAIIRQNPNKGVIINKPNGTNVYPGVPKDYIGDDVTPENFLALLQGEKPQSCNNCSGKTMKSGSNDHVFVYFADHGGPDIIAFPDGEVEKTDLMKALKKMHTHQQFGKLVFYLEACESGSMFEGMATDLNIYATTAANPDESSWGFYCDNPLDNCLGDEYSIHWMEDSDVEDLSSETLKKQFRIVKNETKKSHPQEYGNLTMASATVNEYQSGSKGQMHILGGVVDERIPTSERDLVPSREVEMTMLHRRLMKATHPTDRDAILKKIMVLAQTQRDIIQTMRMIIQSVTFDTQEVEAHLRRPDQLAILNPVCYHSAVKLFSDKCFRLGQNDYAMGIVYAFANMCNKNVQQEMILNAIKNIC